MEQKRKTRTNTNTNAGKQRPAEAAKGRTTVKVRALSENQRWGLGFVMLMVSLYMFFSAVCYLFTWAKYQSAVKFGWTEVGERVSNACGGLGAWLAEGMIGRWFGVFGVLIPVILVVLSFRFMRLKKLRFPHAVRVSLSVMILGSLTFGLLFADRWGVFGSGLGGAHGIFIVRDWMQPVLGTVGTALLLLCGWVLLGVYINRNTIRMVNRVSEAIVDGSVKVGGAAMNMVHREGEHKARRAAEEPDSAAGGTGASEPMPGPDSGPAEQPGLQPGLAVQQTAGQQTVGQRSAGQEAEAAPRSEAPLFEITDRRNRREPEPRAAERPQEGPCPELELGPQPAEPESRPEAVRPVEGFAGDDPFRVITVNDMYARGFAGGELPAEEPGPEEEHEQAPLETAGSGESFEVVDLTAETWQRDEEPRRESGGELREDGFIVLDAGEQSPESDAPEEPETAAQQEPAQNPESVPGGEIGIGGVLSGGGGEPMRVEIPSRSDATLSEEEIENRLYDPTLELSKYQRPPVELLEDHSVEVNVTKEEVEENNNQIVRTLGNFGIKVDKVYASIGPTVTLYEIVPAAGVKISKIKNLEDDISLSLKSLCRIIPIPDKGTVGIEVPNKDKEVVSMFSVVKSLKFQECKYDLPVVLGKTIMNETFVVDLAKMPHLLVAGATGQGKSVGLNAIIASLLYKKHPAELKFVLVDPKKVELSVYRNLERHFLAKMESEQEAILTDNQKVIYTLNSLCNEMDARYGLLQMAGARKISEYNEKFTNRRLNPNKGHRFLPYIVVVVDEFADLIMTAGREVEAPIQRLAQLARAVGIHLIIATQRPDVKVITGVIKANFPARIAFKVSQMIDSRTIIDQPGANQLIGRGDMLISINNEVTRVQCAFIDTPEIERVVEFIGNQRGYGGAYPLPDFVPDSEAAPSRTDMGRIDDMFAEVAEYVVLNQQGSTSSIQRRFSIGYNRAGRIMDQLEAAGIVGRAEGSKPREVLLSDISSLDRILKDLNQN